MIHPFAALLASAQLAAQPDPHLLAVGGRNVPLQPRWPAGPRLRLLAPTHPDGTRAERRAAASPRVRPAPSTPQSRAWLARHRVAIAQARCAAREAREAARG